MAVNTIKQKKAEFKGMENEGSVFVIENRMVMEDR